MERMEGRDAADVERARGGDAEAFRALVERHSQALFRLAYRMTGSEPDAEDVVQEALLKAYRRLDQFESRANFGSWLYRIAANCAFDVLRARARREEQPLLRQDPEGSLQAVDPAAPEPTADRLVLSTEVRRRLDAAMARLSALERSAFVLRHFEEMSIREIATVLGLDAGAAKHSVFRAVRKLREALEPVAPLSALERGRQ
jgi:RNA polymerase sigma-70 factor (ECF subfamily)